ncbi:hypothetical protein [Halorussus ruber]|uniref:hypothetical protein n=1 Tax=Halorussus ruber TaxID=1126238 RepID=UPI001B2FF8FF|nr:hypothetical protein [Halorussus ruber]
MRRVGYLRQVGFLREDDGYWLLGDAGREYVQHQDVTTLLRIMCERNVGLRSLLYALSAGPMTIMEISDQQLDTNPELGWSRGETDMAKQRANWLRSMDLVEKRDDEYVLTDSGWQNGPILETRSESISRTRQIQITSASMGVEEQSLRLSRTMQEL